MKQFATVLAFAALSVAAFASQSTQNRRSAKPTDAIRKHLSVEYDGLLVYNEDADLKRTTIDEMRDFLPDTEFFVTSVDNPSGHWCYPRVEVVIAVKSTTSGDDIRTCLSPTFNEPSHRFLSLIKGVTAKSEEDRIRLATALGKTLAAVTHKGEVRNPTAKPNSATVELWHNERHWRTIAVVFGTNKKCESVSVVNPRAK